MNRRDWHIGPLWVIKRNYTSSPQYGWMLWRSHLELWWVLDVWFKKTLWTLRIRDEA